MRPMRALVRTLAVAGACGAVVAASLAVPGTARAAAGGPGWRLTPTGGDARFRGLAAVSGKVAWLAGSGGAVLRTTDAGRTWQDVAPPGAAGLEFRDIEAFDARRAVVLAIGEGDASRVYATSDGGRSWTLGFQNDDPRAFYDCVTFFDSRHGLAMSDPVDGRFRIISTSDAGRTWRVLPDEGMPPALEGEAGFAAGGQCLVSHGPRDVWLATGGGSRSRVFHSRDRGLTWTVADTPLPSSPSQGCSRWRSATPGTASRSAATTGRASRPRRPRRRPPTGAAPGGRHAVPRPSTARGSRTSARPRWPWARRAATVPWTGAAPGPGSTPEASTPSTACRAAAAGRPARRAARPASPSPARAMLPAA
ncbi:oxidoreductase [Actinomadura madurae]|uniref:WD40/YVTN/BNR-like repeat-containing protein n=1 Tax=Actinomadura madurae TaxID=1993 RepID=UPI0020D220CB|nr:oxidoreductase [Actinomadura madurae]MCP9969940.1 oxidoreductase [Actinomadura madurae]